MIELLLEIHSGFLYCRKKAREGTVVAVHFSKVSSYEAARNNH